MTAAETAAAAVNPVAFFLSLFGAHALSSLSRTFALPSPLFPLAYRTVHLCHQQPLCGNGSFSFSCAFTRLAICAVLTQLLWSGSELCFCLSTELFFSVLLFVVSVSDSVCVCVVDSVRFPSASSAVLCRRFTSQLVLLSSVAAEPLSSSLSAFSLLLDRRRRRHID